MSERDTPQPGDERIWAEDESQWAIQKLVHRKNRNTKKPEQRWEAVRWYPTLETAVKAAAERWARKALLDEEVSDLRGAVSHAVAALRAALPDAYEVTVTKKGG